MLSRLLTAVLLPVLPLLLGCGSWGQLMIENEAEEQILLTLCDAGYGLALPDCEMLKTQLESGESIIVGDAWFNHPSIRDELAEWLERSQNSLVVNRISPGPAPHQWLIEVWLHQNGELRAITDVFERFTDDFWYVLEDSIFIMALESPEAFSQSKRSPIDLRTLTATQRLELLESPESLALLELFQGNQLVFTGTLQVGHRITRGCTDGLEQVFPVIEGESPNPEQ